MRAIGTGAVATILCMLGVVAIPSAEMRAAAHGSAVPPLSLSKLHITPDSFKAALTPQAGFGATVSYWMNENGTAEFVVKQRVGNRYVTMKGAFHRRGRQGRDVFPFPGVYHGHKLLKGHYMLVGTPITPGHGGTSVKATFTVK